MTAPSQRRADADAPPEPGRPRHHIHLWTLSDGTPAHAPPARLTHNDQGQIACHLCGRWFTHLGLHLRRHGWSAKRYREAVGLPLHQPLCSADLSNTIATRQRQQWLRDPHVRNRFQPGQALARSGELARIAGAASREREATGSVPAAVRSARSAQLATGRATRKRTRQARLDHIITAAGATDLHDLLRTAYKQGGTLDSLQRLTGLSRQRLRTELTAAAVQVRPVGHNLTTSKTDRARSIDSQVATRVGTTDIGQWLHQQRAAGATVRELALATDRSTAWIRSRLTGTTTSRPARHLGSELKAGPASGDYQCLADQASALPDGLGAPSGPRSIELSALRCRSCGGG